MTERTKSHVVYTLSDPQIGAVVYVGKTMYPNRRKREHSTLAGCKPRLPVGRWARSLIMMGQKPRFTVIETCASFEECAMAEIRWIEFYKKNSKLLNLTNGGEGTYGYSMSSETKEKIGKIHRGVKRSAETKAALSASRKGMKLSDAHKANIKLAMNRPDVIEKISTSVRASKTPELRLKAQAAMRGRVFSDEHRKNLSRAMKGRVFSERTRAIMSANRKGRRFVDGRWVKVT